MSESVILIGGSGHAKVIIDCIRSAGGYVAGILDDGIAQGTIVSDVAVLGRIEDYANYMNHSFLVAIGNNRTRKRIAEKMNVKWSSAIHASAVISPYAEIGPGTVVMPGAVVNAGARIGAHCIVNTNAVVEHDCLLGDYVHICPGAALGGTVEVGTLSQIGIGASVKNNLNICKGCIVGAGSVVIRDIREPGIYVGIPAGRKK